MRLAPLQAFLADEQVDLTLPGSAPPGRTLVFEDEPVALRDSLAPLADSVCGGAVSDDLKTFAAACSDVEIVCGGADGGEPETRAAPRRSYSRGQATRRLFDTCTPRRRRDAVSRRHAPPWRRDAAAAPRPRF